MKQIAKRLLTLVCAAATAASVCLSAAAQTLAPAKEEVVYATLSHSGEVQNIYVVNSFALDQETQLVDYGSYERVSNLTTTDPLAVVGDKISITAPKGIFYYQGDLATKKLPWSVAIQYALDGQKISGEALAGKSGRLTIQLDITNNEGFDPVYYDNFALQLSVTLQNEKARNIVAPDATVANAGKNKQLSYIVLPGKEPTFLITADVQDFEMEGIMANGIPLTLNIDDPDTGEFKEQIFDLRDAVEMLDDGVNSLLDGVKQLEDGTGELSDGAEALRDGAQEMVEQTQGMSQLGLQGSSLAAAAEQIFLAALAQTNPSLTPDNYQEMLESQPQALEYLSGLDAFRQGLKQYTDGVAGLSALSRGLAQLADGLEDFYDGTLDIHDAVIQLQDGVTELADGTFEMREETSDLDTRVDDEIDKLMDEYRNDDFTLVSFTSPKNTRVDSVQFSMLTAEIKLPDTTAELPQEQSPTLWQRILNLFKWN